MQNVSTSTDTESAAQVSDLVLEAIVENLKIKQDLFGRLDKIAPAWAQFHFCLLAIRAKIKKTVNSYILLNTRRIWAAVGKHRRKMLRGLCLLLVVSTAAYTLCCFLHFQTHHLCQQHILPAHLWHRQLHQQAGQIRRPSLLQPSPYDEACRGRSPTNRYKSSGRCLMAASLKY